MSKYTHINSSKLEPVKNTRYKSVSQIKKDFSLGVQEDKKHYDTRLFYDIKTNKFYYPWMFSKTLDHGDTVHHFPCKEDVDKIISGYFEGKIDSIVQHPETTRKLENVNAGQSFCLMGTDTCVPHKGKFYHVDSEEGVFEMAEVYSQSLLRDTPFSDFDSLTTESIHLSCLNNFVNKTSPVDENGMITGKILHRGNTPDELVGPYISQFLYLPYNYGNIPIEQKYYGENDYVDSVIPQNWLNIQNGKVDGTVDQTTPKYVYCPRILGAKVHNDPLFQFYYQAALIAFSNGISPTGHSHDVSSSWTSGGPPDVLASVAHVCLGSLRVAWHNKYGVGMKIRPEVFAQRIELAHSQPQEWVDMVPGLSTIKTESQKMSSLLQEVMNDNKNNTGVENRFLKLQFPEGSPVHPSYPAGHAVVAGAGVTVLKAMLSTHDDNGNKKPWPLSDVKHSINGDDLINYLDDDKKDMTIVGELNKLASNVSLGRDFAGVHYRADGTEGMVFGEEYAITYLVDKCKEYTESYNGLFQGFTLEKFDGSTVRITHTGVKNI